MSKFGRLAPKYKGSKECVKETVYLAYFGVFLFETGTLSMKNIPELEEGDYYWSPEGYRVFTEKYHLKRGYCCESGCRHCPYGYKAQ